MYVNFYNLPIKESRLTSGGIPVPVVQCRCIGVPSTEFGLISILILIFAEILDLMVHVLHMPAAHGRYL